MQHYGHVLMIVPTIEGMMLYGIHSRGHIQLYELFDESLHPQNSKKLNLKFRNEKNYRCLHSRFIVCFFHFFFMFHNLKKQSTNRMNLTDISA